MSVCPAPAEPQSRPSGTGSRPAGVAVKGLGRKEVEVFDARWASRSAMAVPPYSTKRRGVARNSGHSRRWGGGRASRRGFMVSPGSALGAHPVIYVRKAAGARGNRHLRAVLRGRRGRTASVVDLVTDQAVAARRLLGHSSSEGLRQRTPEEPGDMNHDEASDRTDRTRSRTPSAAGSASRKTTPRTSMTAGSWRSWRHTNSSIPRRCAGTGRSSPAATPARGRTSAMWSSCMIGIGC